MADSALKFPPPLYVKPPQERKLNVNVHASMVAFPDPYSRDRNEYQVVGDLKEKRKMVQEFVNKHWGQVIQLVNIKDGRVHPVYFGPYGPNASRQTPQKCAAPKQWAYYILFGDWRIASEDDIKKQEEKDRIAHEKDTRLEAKRMAKAAGLMFKEVAGAADAIVRLNNQQPSTGPMPADELKDALTEPTDAELDEMETKLAAVKAARLQKAAQTKITGAETGSEMPSAQETIPAKQAKSKK